MDESGREIESVVGEVRTIAKGAYAAPNVGCVMGSTRSARAQVEGQETPDDSALPSIPRSKTPPRSGEQHTLGGDALLRPESQNQGGGSLDRRTLDGGSVQVMFHTPENSLVPLQRSVPVKVGNVPGLRVAGQKYLSPQEP